MSFCGTRLNPRPSAPPWTRCCGIRIGGWRMSARSGTFPAHSSPARTSRGKSLWRRAASPCRRAHPLHATIQSLPARVSVQARTDFLDTAENRFAKMVLAEFRDFLADVAAHLARQGKGRRQARDGAAAARGGAVARDAGNATIARLFPRCVAAHGAAAGQSGAAAQGGLPRTAAVLAAVPRRGAIGLGWRCGGVRGRGAQRGDTLRILAVLPVGGALPAAVRVRAAAARVGREQGPGAAATRVETGRRVEDACRRQLVEDSGAAPEGGVSLQPEVRAAHGPRPNRQLDTRGAAGLHHQHLAGGILAAGGGAERTDGACTFRREIPRGTSARATGRPGG